VETNVARVSSSSADPQATNNRSTHTTTIAGPNLAVTKLAPTSAAAGDQITYTLTAQNLGPVSAQGAVLTDTIPEGVTFVFASGGPTYEGNAGLNGVVRWNLGDLTEAAGVQTFQVTVRVGPAFSGTLTNVAGIGPVIGDPVPSNNRATASTGVGTSADVVVEKTAPATGIPGGQLTYTVSVRNDGPSDASGVVVTDTLPSGVAFVSASGGGVHDAGAGTNGVVTWTVGNLTAAAGPVSYEVVVGVDGATTGALVNVAAVTSPTPEGDPANNRVTAATSVTGSDLVVGKTAPPTADPGDRITDTLMVQNAGPSTATGVVLTDTLPTGVTFVSASGGGVHDAGAGTNGVVTWNLGDLAVAAGPQTRTVTLDIGAGTAGVLQNVAAVVSASTDPDLSDNRVTAPTDVQRADVSIAKAGPATAAPGSQVSYTLTVQNAGPSAATNVVVTDTLPPGATFVSASGGATPLGGVVTWNVANLAATASQVFNLTVSTAPGAVGSIRNASAVWADQFDGVSANDSSSVTTSLVASADLAITKTGPASALPGAQITYTLTAQNLGPSDASGVRVKDILPGSVTFVSASQPFVHHEVGDSVTWTIGTLKADSTRTLTLVVDVSGSASGGVVNQAFVASTTADPVPDNNLKSFSTSVSGADLNLTKTAADDGSPTIGEQVTYTLTVRNDGPSTSANVVLRDTLPVGVSLVSATGTPGVAGRVLTWSPVASLASGASFARTVVVGMTSVGSLRNAAHVTASASTPDYDLANNYDSVTTVSTAADLVAGATAPATALAGETIAFGASVHNNGPVSAQATQVTMTLPPGVTFVTATGGVTPTAGVLTWAAGPLAADSTKNYSATVTVVTATTDTVKVAVSSTTPDPVAGNNTATAVTTVSNSADIAITKAITTAGPYLVGQNLTYRITVQNLGGNNTNQVIVTDQLPKQITLVSITAGTYDPGTRTVTWNAGLLRPLDPPKTMDIVVTADSAGTILNTASVTPGTVGADPNLANNTDTAEATVTLPTELVATATAPGTASAGNSLSYSVTVDVDVAATGTLTQTVNVSSSTTDPGPGLNSATATTTLGEPLPASLDSFPL